MIPEWVKEALIEEQEKIDDFLKQLEDDINE